ncbi:MAG TPA: TniQ family protein, partial [Ktedonobacteraceae bacterium]|nr:TniQ family protein [Ktedonobacteraceae bacterium]
GLVTVFSGRGGAMSLNSTGAIALEGVTLISQLTNRSDLHWLTLRWWAGDFPFSRNMRMVPAWCDACYAEWREQGSPLYQPLLWMLQVITLCPSHKRPLRERCPHCQKHQSVIATSKTRSGECTQCGGWLGTQQIIPIEVDEETVHWQDWIVHSLEALHLTTLSSRVLPWQTFFACFASGMKSKGAFSQLARLTGIQRGVLYRWMDGKDHPSFERILHLCYVCGVTPLEVMDNQLSSLKQALQSETALHALRVPRSLRKPVNQERCQEFIQRVLDGVEGPLGVTQIAKRLDCNATTLLKRFPDECAVITERMQHYRAQRKAQRIARGCEEVRQAVITLHAQGVYPSHRRVGMLLSQPSSIRQPEMRAAWHKARHELGIELPSPSSLASCC